MKKPQKRIVPNLALRDELVGKGLIVPWLCVPQWLLERGFDVAAKAAFDRRKGWFNAR